MCNLVREAQGGAERGAPASPPGSDGLRPRWIGVAGAALIATVAFAGALGVQPASAPEVSAKRFTDGAPIAAKANFSTGSVVEQRTGVDDGVPGATEISKARAGGCEHGM